VLAVRSPGDDDDRGHRKNRDKPNHTVLLSKNSSKRRCGIGGWPAGNALSPKSQTDKHRRI
jgi:hypothetical protein